MDTIEGHPTFSHNLFYKPVTFRFPSLLSIYAFGSTTVLCTCVIVAPGARREYVFRARGAKKGCFLAVKNKEEHQK